MTALRTVQNTVRLKGMLCQDENFPRVHMHNLHIYYELAEQDLFSFIKAQLFLNKKNYQLANC